MMCQIFVWYDGMNIKLPHNINKIFSNYDHLCGWYLGCFCKDEMDKLQTTIVQTVSMYERSFALLNTGSKHSNGEHWMGLVINMRTRHAGYFDTFCLGFAKCV